MSSIPDQRGGMNHGDSSLGLGSCETKNLSQHVVQEVDKQLYKDITADNSSSGVDSYVHHSIKPSIPHSESTMTLNCKYTKIGMSPCSLMGSSQSSLPSTESENDSNNVSSNSSCEQHDRDKSRQEMMQTVQEMKKRLLLKGRSQKPSTADALNYALRCVKQVQANGDYYQQLWRDEQMHRTNVPTYCIEELQTVLSEHTLKNTDSFVVLFSLISGRIVYISEQAPYVLNCKKKLLESCRLVELLDAQDISVFYSHTSQANLPPWNVSSDTVTSHLQHAQVKPFFCRIKGGKEHKNEIQFYPFRLTPYLLNVHDVGIGETQPCCLALAERIHSGYEAPRIPLDKRIFTTTHTPGCIFLEVDERAVPLLGYLPQDLIGSSILSYLHPEDRQLMIPVHRKVLKYAGQPPFEHSPLRFCAQNGDYVMLDTSWTSFVNPWSRKVAFIIGRHRVRMGPVNEDVFSTRNHMDMNCSDTEVRELQGLIYKLLLQPVHNNGSSGYGSMGSNGSHEQYHMASSSDSNGNCGDEMSKETMTLQQICASVNKVKNQGQQVYIESRSKMRVRRDVRPGAQKSGFSTFPQSSRKPEVKGHLMTTSRCLRSERCIPSYQQINCIDGIMRYLESCSSLAMKRKFESSSSIASSSTEEEKPCPEMQSSAEVTATEDPAVGIEQGEPRPANPLATAVTSEEFKKVGLTKEVLSAHTQKEEQNYVDQFRQKILQSCYGCRMRNGGENRTVLREQGDFYKRLAGTSWRKSRYCKHRHKRQKPLDSSESNQSQPNHCTDFRKSSSNQTAWSIPQSSQVCSSSMAFQAPLMFPFQPAYSVPAFPSSVPLGADCPIPLTNLGASAQADVPCNSQTVPGFSAPCMTPVVAVFLPNYPVYPQMNSALPQTIISEQCQSSFSVMSETQLSMPQPEAVNPPESLCRSFSPFSDTGQQQEEMPEEQTALFSSSRSSSPLQLNLLQEELPQFQDHPSRRDSETSENLKCEEGDDAEGLSNRDNQSNPSDLLDLLLQEDSQSGTGSAESGSGSAESSSLVFSCSGSGSIGTLASGTGSSKYFASIDSSDNSRKGRIRQDTMESKVLKTCVADSMWTMIEHTPEAVMMTYQVPSRNREIVLKQDLEKLLAMRNAQPRFTALQKEELAEVHPWIRNLSLPPEIDNQGCLFCEFDGTFPQFTECPETEDTSVVDPKEQREQLSTPDTLKHKDAST
ncbi:period circadian protein homolog 3 isoform X2 [Protopterus annectens]|uniref:period circadian protein homolog 3 isoform X2 n=1 Tax=Protopterus annectens TaxID=7888 RepID=UPI001CFBF36D|nr:period circadian protein homolog 3 isoform X2 [Protopterus annectens]